jgi:hypothetical protein
MNAIKHALRWTTFLPIALAGLALGYVWHAFKDGFDSAEDIIDWMRD